MLHCITVDTHMRCTTHYTYTQTTYTYAYTYYTIHQIRHPMHFILERSFTHTHSDTLVQAIPYHFCRSNRSTLSCFSHLVRLTHRSVCTSRSISISPAVCKCANACLHACPSLERFVCYWVVMFVMRHVYSNTMYWVASRGSLSTSQSVYHVSE